MSRHDNSMGADERMPQQRLALGQVEANAEEIIEKSATTALILVVDDEETNRLVLSAILRAQGYRVETAHDGVQAVQMVQKLHPDLVLMDVMMPELDGYEVTRLLKAEKETKHIPIVMVTALNQIDDKVQALEAGADDFMSKPVDNAEVRARVRSLLKIKAYQDYLHDYRRHLEEEVARRTSQLSQAFDRLKNVSLETVVRLSRAAEYKDDDTGAHIMRMSHYSAALARTLGFDENEVETILHAAPMHDIGKIGIPDHILLKPGKLNEDEWEVMRQHAYMGKNILENSESPIIRLGEIIAHTHHERWDGSGYPRRLKGEQIPKVGRLVALADVYDALTSRRPYKEPFSIEKARAIIQEGRGSHFDPEVVDAFLAIEDEILDIRLRYQDAGTSWLYGLMNGKQGNGGSLNSEK